MRSVVAILAVVVAAAALVAVPEAGASRYLQNGIYDDAQILYGNPDKVFPTLKALNTQVIRVTLAWGGPSGVATSRPARPTDPADPAYNWATYDRTVQFAATYGIKVIFTVLFTPAWANDGQGPNVAPKNANDLKLFVRAAARRYDGTYVPPGGKALPGVRYWVAWNEPSNPVFLTPQWKRVGSNWVVQSARDYARICNAVVAGIRAIKKNGGKVGCGVTAPRGNNNPNSSRPSVSPLVFLSAMKAAGAKGFDAYVHHPYYGDRSETPSTPPPPGSRGQAPTAITLGNFAVLERAVKAAYGNVRIWITEYGYQTNPPDALLGVSYARQAAYMKQAYATVKADRKVDLFLWFLLQDEPVIAGWQSGLVTATGSNKPAFATFKKLRG